MNMKRTDNGNISVTHTCMVGGWAGAMIIRCIVVRLAYVGVM